jgi:hypothetical protein
MLNEHEEFEEVEEEAGAEYTEEDGYSICPQHSGLGKLEGASTGRLLRPLHRSPEL